MVGERYKILNRIGQGGMGAVYLVQDQHLKNRQWAMKEMSDANITNPLERRQAIDAFQGEAKLLGQLAHTNLPKVIDVLSQGNKHYLVMDYIEGKTLEDLLLERQQPFSEAEVLRWAAQLCEVLSYLHHQTPPIIFRDFKPANIILTPSGDVKLIDFGIARLFKKGKSGDTVKLGTPGYAPVEQYGQGQTDVRSDIYALGVTLHRLLTGYDPTDKPFDPLPKTRQLNPVISVALERVIEQATQTEAQSRFQTAAEMKQALTIN
jgi:serine/threonine-protein kinase